MNKVQEKQDPILVYQKQQLHCEKSRKVKACVVLSGIFIALAALATFAALSYLSGGLLPLGIIVYALASGAGVGVISSLGATVLLIGSKYPSLPSLPNSLPPPSPLPSSPNKEDIETEEGDVSDSTDVPALVLSTIERLGASSPNELYLAAGRTLTNDVLGLCLMAYRAEKKLASRMLRDSSEQTLENLNHIVQLHGCYSPLDLCQGESTDSFEKKQGILRALWESQQELFTSDPRTDDMAFVIIDAQFQANERNTDLFMQQLNHHGKIAQTSCSRLATKTSSTCVIKSIRASHYPILQEYLSNSLNKEANFPEENTLDRLYIYAILYILKTEIIKLYDNSTSEEEEDFFYEVAEFCSSTENLLWTADSFDCTDYEDDVAHYLDVLSKKASVQARIFINQLPHHDRFTDNKRIKTVEQTYTRLTQHIKDNQLSSNAVWTLRALVGKEPLEITTASSSASFHCFHDLYLRIQENLAKIPDDDSADDTSEIGYSIEEVNDDGTEEEEFEDCSETEASKTQKNGTIVLDTGKPASENVE